MIYLVFSQSFTWFCEKTFWLHSMIIYGGIVWSSFKSLGETIMCVLKAKEVLYFYDFNLAFLPVFLTWTHSASTASHALNMISCYFSQYFPRFLRLFSTFLISAVWAGQCPPAEDDFLGTSQPWPAHWYKMKSDALTITEHKTGK